MAVHAEPHGTKLELAGHWGLGPGSNGGETSSEAVGLRAGAKVVVGEREGQGPKSPRSLSHQSPPSQDPEVMPQSLTPQTTALVTLQLTA